MAVNVTQRNSTRNQSTADFEQKKIFLFDNRFSIGTIENLTDPAENQTLKAGQLVFRATNGKLTLEGLYSQLVGVLAIDGEVVLAGGDTLDITYCHSGTVDGGNLILQGADTLNTVSSGLAVRDYLNNIGLHVESVTEMTSFDN